MPSESRPAVQRRAAHHPTPVVFPLASPPDDPGPELGETPQRGRTYLQ
jgi:hypothetical protein